jgi:isopentenyl-diphosphate delta-isomerase
MIGNRKADHVSICLKENVVADHNYWDDVTLIHQALPEIDISDIDLRTNIFGVELDAPIIISAITGGYKYAEIINKNLAYTAEKLKIGLGVGSQRACFEDKSLERTYSVVKDFEIPLVIANIGAPQLVDKTKKFSVDDGRYAMEMIGADLLAVHLNYLQEVVQIEGEPCAAGCLSSIKELSEHLPIVVKETGAGISQSVALNLKNTKIKGLDVGGLSGTNFAKVEYFRAIQNHDTYHARLGLTFSDWGIPTPASVYKTSRILDIPVIATGGIRTGLDVARALCVGASTAGIAGKLLKPSMKDSKSVIEELSKIIKELKATMFLIGCKNTTEMKKVEYLIHGKLKYWF